MTFGMSTEQLSELLGEPTLIRKNSKLGETDVRFRRIRTAISDHGLVEVGLIPEERPTLRGIDIFNHPNALNRLNALDGTSREILGFLVFPKLGITVTGLHDGDSSQLAITAFVQGRWDRYL